MSRRFYVLGLHRNEWERLKGQGGPLLSETAAIDSREEYFNALNEQSKKWIDLWPDSAEGVREKLERQRRKQRKDNIALVDAFRKSRKHNDTQAAVKQAKQQIFDDSCYGRQLISAMTESNILEEREVQIQFRNEIKRKAELEKNKIYSDSPFVSGMSDEEKEAHRKLAALECVKFNQEIELMKKEQVSKLKAEKYIYECVDENMVKKFREIKSKKKTEKIICEKKEVEEYEIIRKEIEKRRKLTEEHDNALIEAYKKEQERMKCKMDATLKNIIKESQRGNRAVKFYKVIEELQKVENKRYEDFIEKGIKMNQKRNAIKEANEIEIENKKRAERYKISVENKIAGEEQHTVHYNKCACDIQTLLVKPDAEKRHSGKKHTVVAKPEGNARDDSEKHMQYDSLKSIKDDSKEDTLSFLKPRNRLLQALKRREKEPSGYTGSEDKDKYFAKQASDALQRTKHKCFTRKVVDEYLKMNRLDATALSIPNH